MGKQSQRSNERLVDRYGAAVTTNAFGKFRDNFILAQPDLDIWDVEYRNKGDTLINRGGNAIGSAYMRVSMSPFMANSEVILTSKEIFSFPLRMLAGMSASQRIVGQECEISLVGVDPSTAEIQKMPAFTDIPISGTVTIATNVATINTAQPHGLKGGDRIILFGNTERRLNVGPVVATPITATQFTVPCTLANGTYTAGGNIRWSDITDMCANAGGIHWGDSQSGSSGSLFARRNGASIRSLPTTIASTTATQGTVAAYTDSFLSASQHELLYNLQEIFLSSRVPESVASSSGSNRISQGIPDDDSYYKIRLRFKNLQNFTVPTSNILTIAKTGTTTATVTTDVAHGLTTSDFVQIYGVLDIVNFPNLTASTQVASIINATTFTIVIGGAVTASSVGGVVAPNQGSVLLPGALNLNIQSIQRTNNVMTVTLNTTASGFLNGEYWQLAGMDGAAAIYSGAYKVLRMNLTTVELESIGYDFGLISCGGALLKRTDYRIHFMGILDYSRSIVQLDNQNGSADLGKAIPVVMAAASTVAIGTATSSVLESGQTSSPSMLNVSLGSASTGNLTEVASAARTTSSNSGIIVSKVGAVLSGLVNVSAASGTTPTLDLVLQESYDNGVTFQDIWHCERITGITTAFIPSIPLGGRRRWLWTIAGTTPSFTFSIITTGVSASFLPCRQFFDRTANILNGTLNATTGNFLVAQLKSITAYITIGAATTPATYRIQLSNDGVNWANGSDAVPAVASSTVAIPVTGGLAARFARIICTSAATAQTGTVVSIGGIN